MQNIFINNQNILLITILYLILFLLPNVKIFGEEDWKESSVISRMKFQLDVYNIGEKEKWYAEDFNKSDWTEQTIPYAWDCYDPALWGYEGIGWYSTTIDPALLKKDKIIFLKFNRVNYYSKIWLNGKLIGENIGGFLPFVFDVTNKVFFNKPNHLVIRVDNKPRLEWLPGAIKIEWVQYGGILQNIEVIQKNKISIADVTIKTKLNNKDAKINSTIKISNRSNKPQNLSLIVKLKNENKFTKKVNIHCPSDTIIFAKVQFTIKNAELWSTNRPNLYTMIVSLQNKKILCDKKEYPFGIREIKAVGNNLFLNNKKIYVKGFNRYDIFDKRGPILNEKEIRADLLKIKATGANIIRVHYPQSPLTLNLLDELGIMLIEEIPLNWWGENWWTNEKVTQDTTILKQAEKTVTKMIHRDKNHPSIIIWSLANECKTDSDTGEYVIRKLIHKAKKLDNTRLITFTTNGDVKDHKAFEETDIISCNIYYGNDSAHHFDSLDSLVRKPSENKIREQCSYFPNKPMIVTEFGAGGIKNIHGNNSFSENFQAEYIKNTWKAIKNVSGCSGGILWCWADYYHRKGFNNYNAFGPYGVLNVNRKEKESFKTISKLFHEN